MLWWAGPLSASLDGLRPSLGDGALAGLGALWAASSRWLLPLDGLHPSLGDDALAGLGTLVDGLRPSLRDGDPTGL